MATVIEDMIVEHQYKQCYRKASGFQGLVPHLVEGGLSILQYADDTILFMENDLI